MTTNLTATQDLNLQIAKIEDAHSEMMRLRIHYQNYSNHQHKNHFSKIYELKEMALCRKRSLLYNQLDRIELN